MNRAADNDGVIERNPDETTINIRSKSHLKNVHKKPIEMESDLSLRDFEIRKLKFPDFLVLTGVNEALRHPFI